MGDEDNYKYDYENLSLYYGEAKNSEVLFRAAEELMGYTNNSGYTYTGKIKSPGPDSILKETLKNLKLGLKPYYQEKIPHLIGGSNDGIYIEYDPDRDDELSRSQKIQWLLPALVDKINHLHETKKKAYEEHTKIKKEYTKAKMEYNDTISDIDRAIKNYKEKGHNLIL